MLTTATNTSYLDKIKEALPFRLESTNLALGMTQKKEGKVRDIYELDDSMLLITTDRLSAFDRPLALIPYKGQVLNLISAWWFEQTQAIVPNHLIAVPDPNAILAKKCEVFPVEFVVRGYITGSTNTSLWTHYHRGNRKYCGISFPEGLIKNQKLASPVLTPTTKDKVHDRPISSSEIISEGLMTAKEWEIVSDMALRLYQYGVEVAAKHGLILVDTKYEFGRDAAGNIMVVDEIHTPDSSRYWLSETYEARMQAGLEPENIDKEFLRLWFAKHCDPYHDLVLPEAPLDLVETLAQRYIQLYEMITQKPFVFLDKHEPLETRIARNISAFLRG
jgi:phosphoribosylaminoimidazole-succinocarboxamide synthase